MKYTDNAVKAHILANWDKYGIAKLKSQWDMLKLLNILDVYGETLDSFHNVALNGEREFCEIVFSEAPVSDDETYSALMDNNVFYRTWQEVLDMIQDNDDEEDINAAGGIDAYTQKQIAEKWLDIRKAEDGYVYVMWC